VTDGTPDSQGVCYWSSGRRLETGVSLELDAMSTLCGNQLHCQEKESGPRPRTKRSSSNSASAPDGDQHPPLDVTAMNAGRRFHGYLPNGTPPTSPLILLEFRYVLTMFPTKTAVSGLSRTGTYGDVVPELGLDSRF
jgi:hypothetical protein